MTFDLISGLHMQIQTWHPPLWLCTHAKYYVKNWSNKCTKKCQQNQKYASFFHSDCQLIDKAVNCKYIFTWNPLFLFYAVLH